MVQSLVGNHQKVGRKLSRYPLQSAVRLFRLLRDDIEGPLDLPDLVGCLLIARFGGDAVDILKYLGESRFRRTFLKLAHVFRPILGGHEWIAHQDVGGREMIAAHVLARARRRREKALEKCEIPLHDGEEEHRDNIIGYLRGDEPKQPRHLGTFQACVVTGSIRALWVSTTRRTV